MRIETQTDSRYNANISWYIHDFLFCVYDKVCINLPLVPLFEFELDIFFVFFSSFRCFDNILCVFCWNLQISFDQQKDNTNNGCYIYKNLLKLKTRQFVKTKRVLISVVDWFSVFSNKIILVGFFLWKQFAHKFVVSVFSLPPAFSHVKGVCKLNRKESWEGVWMR